MILTIQIKDKDGHEWDFEDFEIRFRTTAGQPEYSIHSDPPSCHEPALNTEKYKTLEKALLNAEEFLRNNWIK